MESMAIGVDVSGTKIAAGLVDPTGAILNRIQVPTPANDADAIVGAILQAAGELGAGNQVSRIGVCVAGFVDHARARVLFAPNLAWRDFPLRDRLEQSVPATWVIENDANAAAWGEFRFGAGRRVEDLLMVTVGTGVGGGMVVNGQLLRGSHGVAAEIGHLCLVPDGQLCGCGNSGCLESYGSGTALVRNTRNEAAKSPRAADLIKRAGGEISQIEGPMITQAALDGDAFAIEQIRGLGSWLGRGIANIAEITDPAMAVIGGGVSRAGEILVEAIERAYRANLSAARQRPHLEVRIAELGNDAGLVGAADLPHQVSGG